MAENPDIFDRDTLARIGRLTLRARRVVEGIRSGAHRSPLHGASVEFAEHKEYTPGDELRHIDWKLFGKSDKYYVKRFEMEAQLKATIILDSSKSMDFGDGKLTKLQFGSYLAATLAYLLIHQNDMAGLVNFDSQIRTYIPPRGSRQHLRLILHALSQITPGPATNVPAVCHHLAGTIKSRGMIILISDLLDDTEKIMHALRHFQHQKHDVIVFHTLDDSELELPYQELANFRELETGTRVAVDPASFRSTYKSRVNEFCSGLREACLKSNIDYNLVRTSTPIETVVTNYFQFRSRRAR